MPIYKLRNLKSGQAMLIPMGEFVVGRAEGSDLPIDDLSISRRHARIINIDSGLFVEDSGSANGTLLGGLPITRRMSLKAGDVLHFGTVPVRIDPEMASLRPEPVPPARAAATEVVEGETIRLPPARPNQAGRVNGRTTGVSKTAVIPNFNTEQSPAAAPAKLIFEPAIANPPARALSPDKTRAKTEEIVPPGAIAAVEAPPRVRTSATQPVGPRRNVAPAPQTTTTRGLAWLWLILGFFAGVGVGLIGGLVAARYYLELGGKIAGLP